MTERGAVIMGGGITGVLTARELLLRGWSVTLLEGAHIGAGSSSRSACGIRQQFSTPDTVRAMRYCVDFYKRFGDEIGGPTSPIVQNGYLFLHDEEASWAQAQARVRMQHGCGLTEVQALSPAELARRFPWVDASALLGGTHCPTDGFLLPHLIYADGARRVRELGGTIVQSAPVLGAQRQGGTLVEVHTPKGSFAADLFLDCTNAWSPRLAQAIGAELLPIHPLKRYLWFLGRGGEMSAETLADMPLSITPGGVYFRPENRDTLLMGKKNPASPEPNFTYEDQDVVEAEFSPESGVEATPYSLWMQVAESAPPIGDFDGFVATTAGYYASTPDHNPFLAYDPRLNNLIRLVGFSGHGAMMGPFTAQVGAALAEAGAGANLPALTLAGHQVSLSPFSVGRPFDHAEAMVI